VRPLLVLLVLAAAAPAAQAATVTAPTAGGSWAARVLAPVVARAAPDRAAKPITVLQPVAPLGHGPTVVAVRAVRRVTDVQGRRWVRVLLPVRPNGREGWIPTDVLRFRHTALRIVIDQSDRRLVLYSAGRPVLRARIAIGTASTPTPNGTFAVAEMIRTHSPGAFLGPIVFPLTGYSETLNEYAGGNGRVAMHGTSLPHLIGTRASHGCIRLNNQDVLRLSRVVRPGTPVTIRD
jgi:lipoprotein-anchoring transpeptidase ErfK/SrfK